MLRKQIKFTCIVLQLLTWRMKELMGNITGVCRIWDKHQFLMPSLNLMPGLKLWVCFWVCAYVCVCGVIFEVSLNGALLMRWGQRAALTIMGSSDFLTHRSLSLCRLVFSFIYCLFASLSSVDPLSLLLPHWIVHFPPSLAPSLSLQGTILCCLSTRGCYLKHLEVI